jgi:hypothetical protein
MPSYSQIRLNKTKELQEMLRFLKSQLRLLSETEIMKLAISEFYEQKRRDEYINREQWIASLPEIEMTVEEEERVGQALGEYAQGKGESVDVFDPKQAKKCFGV